MEKLPKVLTYMLCNYILKNDVDSMFILSKKIYIHVLKYKLEHFNFYGPI